MEIIRAEIEHLELVVPLFDQYRQFYRQPSDLPAAQAYLAQRLEKGDAVIFVAVTHEAGKVRAHGFVQLYPSLASIPMRPIWILYDLYVAPASRKRGIGRALMERSRILAEETDADSLLLETAADNNSAQRLYESLGYKRDEVFHRYALALKE